MVGQESPRVTDPDSSDDLSAELARLRERNAELEAELAYLRPSEAELRAIFRAMTDLVLVMSREGRYLRIVETAPDLLYQPSPQLIGKHMHEVMPAETADYFLGNIREALDGQRVVSMDYSLPVEGREVWFSANISPMSRDTAILVCRDVSERKRHEQLLEDSLRQQELLRAQEMTLARLSTPLIPISDSVVVMPLVGHLDPDRAQQVIQSLLEGVEGARVRVAILDITGVPDIDLDTAEVLVRAARSVQLLGARVILTGIRPEVAASLAVLDTDLREIATRGTLQDGVRHAQSLAR